MKRSFIVAVIFCTVSVLSCVSAAQVTVQLAAPTNGSTVTSPVAIRASAVSSRTITAWRIYLDGTKVFGASSGTSISASISMTTGNHRIVVRAWASNGTYGSATAYINVTQPTGTVGVSVSPTTAIVQASQSSLFTASVTGTTNTAVTWSVNGYAGGNSTVGTITTAGLYIAPTAVPSGGSVTLQATSAADATKSASAAVTITTAATPVTIAITPNSGSLQGGQSLQFTASVTGTTNTAANWFVNGTPGGNSTVGTISSTGLYKAPACPSQSSIAVTAQSAYDSSAVSNSASVTLSGAATGTGNYYVAITGSDANDGSACRPWATINHAASLAKAGWTIHVAPGTYNEDVVSQANGTSTARIRFISDQRWGAKVVGQGANNVFQVGSGGNGSYVDVIGFDISGGTASRVGISTYAHDLGLLGNRVHDVPGVGSTASCFAGAGIFIGTGSLAASTNVGSNLVDSNYIYNISTNNIPFPKQCNQAHGIYVGTPSNTISNNIVFRAVAYGIHVYGHVSNETVVNNTTFNNGKSGIVISSDGTIIDDYTTVNNNIAVDNGATYSDAGIEEVSYPSGYIGSHNVYSNNLTFGNSGGNYSLTVSSTVNAVTSGTNNTTFANYTGDAGGDYHLVAGGTAVDAGTSSAAPALDIAGGKRPSALKWDIGAYEYGAAASVYPWW